MNNRPGRSVRGILWLEILLGVLAAFTAPGAEVVAGDKPETLRFAFSSKMFSEVNRNDARASVKAWALALARERGVPMDPQPVILESVEQLQDALRRSAIEGAAVTMEEYFALEPGLQGTNLFLSRNAGQPTEEYLLMVRADSGLSQLADLKGKSLIVLDSPRASLAPLWLDVLLSESKLGRASEFFGPTTRSAKLMKVVSPVFFGQSDACVVTRRGYEVMCEMNQQMRTRLRPLAASPELIPAVGFIRRGYVSPLRDMLLASLRGLENSPSGAQVLTLFQSQQLREFTTECLEPTRLLTERYRRLTSVGGVTAVTDPVAKGPEPTSRTP